MKTYAWKQISATKLVPSTWTSFDWAQTKSLKGYLVSSLIVALFLLDELCLFYMKALLWIPTTHWLVMCRTLLHAMAGAVATREAFQLFTDKNCKKLGPQAWIMAAIIGLETLISFKWGIDLFLRPFPKNVKFFWTFFTALFVLYPFFKFKK